ncbi:hypothetical protein GCM10027444_01690 [Actinopolyspora lacussalsi]
MPAKSAATAEEATVVAPLSPWAGTTDMSRLLTFGIPGVAAKRSMSDSVIPTRMAPSSIQIVAGVAPPGPDGLPHFPGGGRVVRVGQAVCDYVRLQRHDRIAGGEGRPNLPAQWPLPMSNTGRQTRV